jgi:hypothetical protein
LLPQAMQTSFGFGDDFGFFQFIPRSRDFGGCGILRKRTPKAYLSNMIQPAAAVDVREGENEPESEPLAATSLRFAGITARALGPMALSAR